MKNYMLTGVVALLLALLMPSCQTEDQGIIEKDITVQEVQSLYHQISKTNSNGRQTNDLEIMWDEASYRKISIGDALVFPLDNTVNRYVQLNDEEQLRPIEEVSHAFAYKAPDGETHLDLVQKFSTEETESFTGYITVSDWNGESKFIIEYENGQIIESPASGRAEDCTTTLYYECTSVSAGGVEYGHCNHVGSSIYCEPVSTLAPPDFGDPNAGGGGGGLGGGTSNLCPHPTIAGEYITCGTCADGYTKDVNGNCVKEVPGFRVCDYIDIRFDRIPGDGTEESFTGEVQNINVPAFHRPSNLNVRAFWGAWCVTYGASAANVHSSLEASDIFKETWFLTTTEIEVWLNAQQVKPTDAAFSAMYKSMFETNLQILADGAIFLTSGGCLNTSRTRLRYCN